LIFVGDDIVWGSCLALAEGAVDLEQLGAVELSLGENFSVGRIGKSERAQCLQLQKQFSGSENFPGKSMHT
jgi:hypothetical protein